MARPLRHRQTKGAETDTPGLTFTAPHSYSTVKTIACGNAGRSGVLVVTRVLSTNTKCTRGRGCNGHPAFPTPSKGAEDFCRARAHCVARSRTCIWNWSNVIASEAKQSILSLCGEMDC